ncbi:hypothetical protein PMAYCL1PPCAC_28539, partial [Pristionchus mayeri]
AFIAFLSDSISRSVSIILQFTSQVVVAVRVAVASIERTDSHGGTAAAAARGVGAAGRAGEEKVVTEGSVMVPSEDADEDLSEDSDSAVYESRAPLAVAEAGAAAAACSRCIVLLATRPTTLSVTYRTSPGLEGW